MLRIYLTGDICLTTAETVIRADRLPGRQGRVVFSYLVIGRGRAVSRDELAETLWPEHQPKSAEIALSAVISKLRSLLAEIGLRRSAVTAGSGTYRLALPGDSWIDIEAAFQSAHLAEAALLARDPRRAYGPAVVACTILRREFLPGEEGAWIDRQREELRRARLRALDCLAQIHAATGEHALALRAAEEAVDLEPFREAGYRRLMLLHDAAGNRAEAMRVYGRLEALLAKELSTVPGPDTRHVFESVTAAAQSLNSGREPKPTQSR